MDFLKESEKYYDYSVSVRRHLHENPEPSSFETQTVAFILDELEKTGIRAVNVPDGGVLGFIYGSVSGDAVMLRADCDALRVQEDGHNAKGPKVCLSKKDGLAHLCGHDMHTAMLLTAAKILEENRETLRGTVILMFERGEEGGGNAYYIHRYLRENNIRIRACFSLHNDPLLPAGKIAISAGPRFAGSFVFNVKIKGKGGHGSRPDRCNNPIDCFLAIAAEYKDLRMRLIPPEVLFTSSINMINAGTAHNITPEELTFSGTARTYDFEAGIRFREQFRKIIELNCGIFGCVPEFSLWKGPTLPVINQKDAAALCETAAKAVAGEDAVEKNIPDMCGESFGITTAFYPSAMAAVGTGNEPAGQTLPLHSPGYDPDEKALLYGSACYAACAYLFGMARPQIDFQPFEGDIDALFEKTGRPVPPRRDQKGV